VLGQIGSLLGRVEFQLHASNVCLINSCVKSHFRGRRSVGAVCEKIPPCLRARPPRLTLLFVLPSCVKNTHSDSRQIAEVPVGRG
jgi:hypothetical protein